MMTTVPHRLAAADKRRWGQHPPPRHPHHPFLAEWYRIHRFFHRTETPMTREHHSWSIRDDSGMRQETFPKVPSTRLCDRMVSFATATPVVRAVRQHRSFQPQHCLPNRLEAPPPPQQQRVLSVSRPQRRAATTTTTLYRHQQQQQRHLRINRTVRRLPLNHQPSRNCLHSSFIKRDSGIKKPFLVVVFVACRPFSTMPRTIRMIRVPCHHARQPVTVLLSLYRPRLHRLLDRHGQERRRAITATTTTAARRH